MSVLHVLMSVLKDNSGANAVEYALTMVFGAVFIIGGLMSMSTSLKKPLTDTAVCLADAANCASVVTAGGVDDQGGDIAADASGDSGGGNRSGLGNGTNPGAGDGTANSPNEGEDNPGGQGALAEAAKEAREAAKEAREAAREAAKEAREAAREAAEEAREAARQGGG